MSTINQGYPRPWRSKVVSEYLPTLPVPVGWSWLSVQLYEENLASPEKSSCVKKKQKQLVIMRIVIARTNCTYIMHATTCNNPVRNMKAFFELSRIQQEIVQLLGERDPQVQLKMLRYGCTRCPLQSVDSWHPSRNRVASLRADMARGLTSSRNCHAQGRLSQGAHQSTQRALTDQAGSL